MASKSKITIYADNVWAGDGTWDGTRISDCGAVLGPRHADDQDASERAYDAIEGAIGIEDSERVTVDGVAYTWDLSDLS